jgi:hypothetical protein
MNKIISIHQYKSAIDLLEYYNNRLIIAINNYNDSQTDNDYNEYLYYKNELIKRNQELQEIVKGLPTKV